MKSVPEIIRAKRDGKELTTEEIEHLIIGYSRGEIPDYQLAAWAMAVVLNGMTPQETADLTMAMVESGERVDLSQISGIKVDKHSTGGVADTTTLVLAPLVAAAGVKVAKMSGRGLGHTGGTLDKLESIPRFSIDLTIQQFTRWVNQTGLALMGQTADLAPADKKLYALRDVTATVESIPLIASSVMSKKIAAGADAIVLDVKMGAGAFMKTEADARKLAEAMVEIGQLVERKTIAVISDMSQPLGYAVGNALEVVEAIQTLRGQRPTAALTELCLTLGSHMLVLAGQVSTAEEARAILVRCIEDGSAIRKLKEFIANQGGDPSVVDDLTKLPQADQVIPVLSPHSGYVHSIQAAEIGLCAMHLGAGRQTKEDTIDHAVGVVLKKKVGDLVKAGEPLAVLHVNRMEPVEEVTKRLLGAYTFGREPITPPALIRGVVN